jgi:hypothetical protein
MKINLNTSIILRAGESLLNVTSKAETMQERAN